MKTKLLTFCFLLCFGLTPATMFAESFTSLHGYSLTLPPGWRIKPHHAAADDVVADLRQNGGSDLANFRVTVAPLEGDVTLEDLKPYMVNDYKKKVPSTVFKSQNFSSVGGVRDVDLVFTQPKDGILVRLRQVFVLKGNEVYFFTAACPEKTHAKYDAMITQILSSARWKS